MQKNFQIEGQNFAMNQIEISPELKILKQGDVVASISPSETLFGYTYHAHMIPPFRPESMLILGYGLGQIADLTRKIWGNVKITGVDLVNQEFPYLEYKMHIADAYDYVCECTIGIVKTRYDYIAIDLFDGEEVPRFVFEPEFAIRLKDMTKKLI